MCSCLPSALFIIIIIHHFSVRMRVMWVYVQMCFLHVCKCMCVQVRTRVCMHVKARSWFLESSSAHLHLVFWGRFSHRPQSWPIPANLASQLALGILCPWGLWLQPPWPLCFYMILEMWNPILTLLWQALSYRPSPGVVFTNFSSLSVHSAFTLLCLWGSSGL